MNRVRQFIFSIFILGMLLITTGATKAQSTDVLYFPETRHYVKGPFLQFYNAAANPKLVYGYPITEQMTSRDGKTVQYFQRARFELTASNSIQLTPLGRLLYTQNQPIEVNTRGCEQYPTGYYVCFTFLDFYKANGGAGQFGNPISPFETSNGVIVQYFEGARFEWRAYQDTEKWVVISDLGRIYFEQQKEDPAYLRPASPPDATINSVLSLKSRAFVLKAVTLRSGNQNIYVIVQDQASLPIENASVKAMVHFPDNTQQEFSFITNSHGIGQVSFNFSGQQPGELVTIDISIDYLGLKSTTTTSFRIWF